MVDESQRQCKEVGPSVRLRQDKYSGMTLIVLSLLLSVQKYSIDTANYTNDNNFAIGLTNSFLARVIAYFVVVFCNFFLSAMGCFLYYLLCLLYFFMFFDICY